METKLINENNKNSINQIIKEAPKTEKELSNYRLQILNDTSLYGHFLQKTFEYNTLNQANNNFSSFIGSMSQTLGIGFSPKNSMINGLVSTQSSMLTTTNRQIVSAHLWTGAGYVQTPVLTRNQTIDVTHLQGMKIIVGSQLQELATKLDEKTELTTQGSVQRINNESLIFTQANKFATSFAGGVLETGSFAYELLSIVLKEDNFMTYPGGINLIHGSETNTTVPGAYVYGNYFPNSTNAAPGLNGCPMNVTACTLGMYVQNYNSLPSNYVGIPIRREDCSNNKVNNAWFLTYCEHPIQEQTQPITLSTDVNNIYRTFSNTTIMEGINGGKTACFIVVDSDSLVENISIKIGNNVVVSTTVNSPFLNPVVPVVIQAMDDITGITQGVPTLMSDAFQRWKKYFYNMTDLKIVLHVAACVLHKVPLLQAHTTSNGIQISAIHSLGLGDADRALRVDSWNVNGLQVFANPMVLDIANITDCFIDPLLFKNNGNIHYTISTTSLRVRIAAARHWLNNFGMEVINSESLSCFYYRILITANKLITISDITRMISGKPCNIELLNPLLCGCTNQTIQLWFRLFGPILNKIIEKDIGFYPKIQPYDNSMTVVNSLAGYVSLMDCGGLANLALFPKMFDHFTKHDDLVLDNGFEMEFDEVNHQISYTRVYDIARASVYQFNVHNETIYDSLYIQPLLRIQPLIITGIIVSFNDNTVYNQSLTCSLVSTNTNVIYRAWIRRGYNPTSGSVENKKIKIQNNLYYIRSQLSECSFIKELNKDQINLKNYSKSINVDNNVMNSMDF